MLNTPFSPWPSFTQEEALAVQEVLLSNKVNYWTGNKCREFEREFAVFADCQYAVALMNGTVALDLAFKALEVGVGDEVIVTSRTFLASVSSIVNAGAVPVFADIDRDSQNITAETIQQVMTPKTKAIVAVHLAGWPCEMDAIMELANDHGLLVVEDCAQAHGAQYKGRSVGSIGHVGCWSFCQDKIMSTGGEGGMVTTNDKELWSKMWSYKDHGKSWEAVYEKKHPPGFRWVHDSFGTNWRMTEMQAAIGRIQLKRMPGWFSARKTNAARLAETCAKFNCVRVPLAPDYIDHANYKYYVFVSSAELAEGWSRDRIIEEINACGVPCMQGSCSEVYLEKAFDNTDFRPSSRLQVAKELGETSLMFMVHPTLTEANMATTCLAIEKVFVKACK
ncbi:MAG: DegT/DnrJ/EryC1/StrS aminotransferase family protein [Pseudomonadales bacterium]|nr:DegT/DnrJ/EryC1/StrS aminotransferase family protein [Pseudomonadales bacterium]